MSHALLRTLMTTVLLLGVGCDTTLDPFVGPGDDGAADVGLADGGGTGCDDLPTEGCGSCGDGVPTCVEGSVVCVGGEPTLYFLDRDGDGFGQNDERRLVCGPEGAWTATRSGDCDDEEATAWPGAPERCDGIDNDCDDRVDEEADVQLSSCQDVFGARASHCDDGECQYVCLAGRRDYNDDLEDGAQGDGCECDESEEVCDGLDNDCDGEIDEGFARTTFFKDADRDTFGDDEQRVQACAAPPNFVSITGDCDDRDPAVHPGASEICDDEDNDCDGRRDAERCEGEGEGEGECGLPPDLVQLLASCLAPSHAVAIDCDDGRCVFACDDDYEDRNGDLGRGIVGDGCETSSH